MGFTDWDVDVQRAFAAAELRGAFRDEHHRALVYERIRTGVSAKERRALRNCLPMTPGVSPRMRQGKHPLNERVLHGLIAARVGELYTLYSIVEVSVQEARSSRFYLEAVFNELDYGDKLKLAKDPGLAGFGGTFLLEGDTVGERWRALQAALSHDVPLWILQMMTSPSYPVERVVAYVEREREGDTWNST